MKTIFLDSNYMCHLENDGSMIEIETSVFDSISDDAIPYYRFIPQGHEWTDPIKGRIIYGEFIQATDTDRIDLIMQSALISDMANALSLLGVSI